MGLGDVKKALMDFMRGAANGVASLDAGAKIPIAQIPCDAVKNVLVPMSAAAHNGIYRGKLLASIPAASGDPYTIEQLSSMVSSGKFDDIFIGDYIQASVTINGTTTNKKWYFAGFDTFLHNGDTETSAHHAVMIPENALYNAAMNSTNTTANGYTGSAMWTTEMPLVSAGIKAAFGSSHVINHKELLTSAMTGTTPSMAGLNYNGAATGWGWVAVDANICNEAMVYGVHPFSSSAMDIGDRHEQLPLFRLSPDKICTRGYWWLSAVVSSTNFAVVGYDGLAYCLNASYSYGVRPYFLFH